MKTPKSIYHLLLISIVVIAGFTSCKHKYKSYPETQGGWAKYGNNPVLGGTYGVIFDVFVMQDSGKYKMWSSWRTKKSIAYSESTDGAHWTAPVAVLSPLDSTEWEDDINRPSVVKRDGKYLMWYTGQYKDKDSIGRSAIGVASSTDGIHWQRLSAKPIINADAAWEKTSAMCPDVIWDDKQQVYKMWYSAGEQFEPDAIGYAESKDGISWTKNTANPIFKANPSVEWEKAKVTACQVIKYNNKYMMFYIGFEDQHRAHIGIAQSNDGISNWTRNKANPIINSGSGWDYDAVYKPSVIVNNNKWMLWYNGRREHVEQIGYAYHEGLNLGF